MWTYTGKDVLSGQPSGLMPGRYLKGIALHSPDLPGVTMMQMRGEAAIPTWVGGPPEIDTPVGKQLSQIKAGNFIARSVAAPKIPNPTPFNSVVVLESIRNHLATDLQSLNLVDAVFASQLDLPLGAALEAAKIGNTKSVKDNLKDFRKLLKLEHDDVDRDDDKDFDSDEDEKTNQGKPRLIDKLAARVLDFDAKYVLKRLEGN
jgi:hypothetical protein